MIMSIFKTLTAHVISAHNCNFNAASERLYTAAQLGAKWLTEHGSFQRSTMKMAQYMPARKPLYKHLSAILVSSFEMDAAQLRSVTEIVPS